MQLLNDKAKIQNLVGCSRVWIFNYSSSWLSPPAFYLPSNSMEGERDENDIWGFHVIPRGSVDTLSFSSCIRDVNYECLRKVHYWRWLKDIFDYHLLQMQGYVKESDSQGASLPILKGLCHELVNASFIQHFAQEEGYIKSTVTVNTILPCWSVPLLQSPCIVTLHIHQIIYFFFLP